MRILHTADWHLADRLKHVDRTADLERAVERVAALCDTARVDVLLVAGDIFSELARPDALRKSVSHLSRTFRPFLLRGGTVVAVTGNHDNDIYCDTLRRAFQLAAPNEARAGDILPAGRFYLALQPLHFRLAGRQGECVQFICMPYPTAARYRVGEAGYRDFRERSALLRSAYISQLERIRNQLQPELPRVLATHVNVLGGSAPSLFRLGCDEDVQIDDPATTTGWTYVALGHLHKPLKVDGQAHVRYSGSIERLDLGERDQSKGVVLVDIHQSDTPARIRFVPLPATPFYDVRIRDPRTDLPGLRDRHADARDALVRCHVSYRPGQDDLYKILAELAEIFPRCYERTWSAAGIPPRGKPVDAEASCAACDDAFRETAVGAEQGDAGVACARDESDGFAQSVLDYLRGQLRDDPDRDPLLTMAQRLLEERE
ncbi:MAG: exonuclease subunit SbcD [Planctomycetes bacterium]|nr:exonuclease subunit SbcD [Planctomycetota bacterium]